MFLCPQSLVVIIEALANKRTRKRTIYGARSRSFPRVYPRSCFFPLCLSVLRETRFRFIWYAEGERGINREAFILGRIICLEISFEPQGTMSSERKLKNCYLNTYCFYTLIFYKIFIIPSDYTSDNIFFQAMQHTGLLFGDSKFGFPAKIVLITRVRVYVEKCDFFVISRRYILLRKDQ